MKYCTAILATLFALVQLCVSTSLYDATFQNEGAYSLYVGHLWTAIGGKDVPVPIDSALASFNAAKAQGIVPPEAVIDLSIIDSDKDGLISRQELYDNTKAQMQSASMASKVPRNVKLLGDSHLQAAHKSAQATFCNTTNPTSSMTIEDGKKCVTAGNCVASFMPCQAKSSRLQRRNFWRGLVKFVLYAVAAVIIALVVVFLLSLATVMPLIAFPLLGVWIAFWVASAITALHK